MPARSSSGPTPSKARTRASSRARNAVFSCTPDGEWHTYFVYPLWHGKVWRLRLDLPEGEGTKVELDYIRIIQGQRGEHDPKSPVWDFTQGNGAWLAMSGGTHLTSDATGTETTLLADGVTLTSPVLDLKTDDYKVACLELETSGKLDGGLYWSDTSDGNFPGCNAVQFAAPAGRFITTLRLADSPMWAGDLKRLSLRFDGEPGTRDHAQVAGPGGEAGGAGAVADRVLRFGRRLRHAGSGRQAHRSGRERRRRGAPGSRAHGADHDRRCSGGRTPCENVPELAPGEATDVTWTFTPTAEGRTTFALESPDGQRRQTEVVVSRAFPLPKATEKPSAEVGPSAAWIGNDKVLLTLIKGKDGFAHGRLDAVADGKTRPMAVLPHLASLCLEGSTDFADLVFQEAAAEQGDGRVTLRLKGTAEVGGAQVTVVLTLTLQQGKSYIDAAYALTADKALQVAAFRGPWLWAGEGSFGAKQDLALFPGSEYMETGERSSSTLDIAAPMNVRFAPHPNTVTVPSMAVEKDGCIVGLMWDPLQKWDGQHDRPTAVFASPNFIEGHANHLLGLCLPSIPDYLEPNKLLAKKAYELKPGAKLTLSAALYAEAKSEVLRSMDLYFERYGVPALPPKPRSYEDTVAMSLKSYDTVLWDEQVKGWHGVLQWAPGANPGVALRYYVLASRLLQDQDFAAEAGREGPRDGRSRRPHHRAAPGRHTLRGAEGILAAARAGATQVPADGKFGFTPQRVHALIGSRGDAGIRHLCRRPSAAHCRTLCAPATRARSKPPCARSSTWSGSRSPGRPRSGSARSTRRTFWPRATAAKSTSWRTASPKTRRCSSARSTGRRPACPSCTCGKHRSRSR